MKHIYVRLELKTEIIKENCRKRLEEKGVECLMDAQAFQAYAIVNQDYLPSIKFDPDIIKVIAEEPPAGK